MQKARITPEDQELVARILGRILNQKGWLEPERELALRANVPLHYVANLVKGQLRDNRESYNWRILVALGVDTRAKRSRDQRLTWEDFMSYLLQMNEECLLKYNSQLGLLE